MELRNARITDAKAIHALISNYAGHDRMLFRSMADIYENLQNFIVAEIDGSVAGCCSLDIVWADLAEIKSLAVRQTNQKKGVGKSLVSQAIERARQLGVPRIFALTLEPVFFLRQGFEIVQMDELPMKVWSDCARCPKQQNCDEVAVMKEL